MSDAIARDREYDRFGPWVLEISQDDPPPRLFESHLARREQPLLAVKIPRRIARREAHPGMALYDYLVSLYAADVVVLERVEQEVRERTFTYRDVRYLSIHEELLRGSLHLGLPDQPCTLPYNTVSGDVMARVATIIGERLRPAGAALPALPAPVAPPALSFYFERLLREERVAGGGARLLAAQSTVALGAVAAGPLRRLLFGLVDKRLLESVHLSDGTLLRVIDRGRPVAYRWQAVYGRRETIVPLANISAVESSSAGDPTTSFLTISTAGGDCRWAFTRDNPTLPGYRAWLQAIATRR